MLARESTKTLNNKSVNTPSKVKVRIINQSTHRHKSRSIDSNFENCCFTHLSHWRTACTTLHYIPARFVRSDPSFLIMICLIIISSNCWNITSSSNSLFRSIPKIEVASKVRQTAVKITRQHLEGILNIS